MFYAILADIHANLAAFTAVLADIGKQGDVSQIWCLGDVVGYGPDPHQCLELLRQCQHVCIAGNHDWAAIGKADTTAFNPDAATAIQWTAEQLNWADKEYLEKLPTVIQEGDFTLVHGSPREPIWEYILTAGVARENFNFFQSQFCLAGHSHVPMLFKSEKGAVSQSAFSPDIRLILGKSHLIINPGSVGQPRDGDPRASYAVYDSDTGLVRLRRVPYDIQATQDRMMQAGLPVRLVTRLGQGL
ncbi:MAG: metallophosphoesterase family protein [Chloroflexota bacterium]